MTASREISVVIPTLREADRIGALVAELRRIGRFVKLDAAVVTSARRFVERGVARQQLLNIALVAAYGVGVPAERLERFSR